MAPIDLQPPHADQLEVSLFGPGYGECVLVHLGGGSWLIVDSCLDQRGPRQQPALHYLERIGVEPASDVSTVVVSHWHTDHVRGISQVVAACVEARVWISEALTSGDLAAIAQVDGAGPVRSGNPYKEFLGLQQAIENRAEGLGEPHVFRTAQAHQLLHQRTNSLDSEVLALSPSPVDVHRTRAHFASLLTKTVEEWRAQSEIRPNDAAVVLLVTVDGHSALLGADLEEVPSPDRGWQVIVADRLPRAKAEVFKVPHHGSHSGHNEDVWTTLLDRPISIITPFRRSRLPTKADGQRASERSRSTFLTASSRPVTPRQARGADLALRQSVREVYDTEGICGHVQVRSPSTLAGTTDWVVGLDHPARQVA